MSNSRSDQVTHGFQLTGYLLLGIATVCLVLGGVMTFDPAWTPHPSLLRTLSGIVEVLVASAILFLTAGSWARGLAGFLFIVCAKSLISIMIGTVPIPPYHPIPWYVSAEVAGYCLIAGILTLKFYSHPPTLLEKTSLTLLVFATMEGLISKTTGIWPFGAGILALLIARAIDWRKRGRRNTNRNNSNVEIREPFHRSTI
ncbi:MAG: hypothetical protein WAM91_04030 [Candidatus Acidiferrales bacterium]